MQVEALAVQLRPRTMPEACDLGVLLVHRHARSVWSCYAPVFAFVFLLALATSEISPWLPTALVFWLKPWMDRTLLFVLSRAVFGQETSLADVWAHRRSVLWGQWLGTLTLRRLSPWRSYTQAMYQLEGQRGAARRKRRAQLLKARRGGASLVQFVFANVEAVLWLSVASFALWLTPQGSLGDAYRWMTASTSAWHDTVLAALYGSAVLALEPFFVAAGFAMYLNRRVELEAWDIEQEFRRAFAH